MLCCLQWRREGGERRSNLNNSPCLSPPLVLFVCRLADGLRQYISGSSDVWVFLYAQTRTPAVNQGPARNYKGPLPPSLVGEPMLVFAYPDPTVMPTRGDGTVRTWHIVGASYSSCLFSRRGLWSGSCVAVLAPFLHSSVQFCRPCSPSAAAFMLVASFTL